MAAGEGPDFQNLHRNKRSMTLNLKVPQGLAAFRRMARRPMSSSRISVPM